MPRPRRSIAPSTPVGSSAALPPHLQHLNLNAAAIDVGASSHFVAVPPGRDSTDVREFATFTSDLYRLADW